MIKKKEKRKKKKKEKKNEPYNWLIIGKITANYQLII